MLKGKVFLVPENENYKSLQIEEEMNFEIWGVVTNVIHPL
jgi:DNA polymerase V